jgi:hypothetical protein
MKVTIVVTLLALQLVFPSAASAQSAPARPLDPTTAIVEAFSTYHVVALGEGNHGNVQGAVFRETLYRDPRFQNVVNDIVVEWGNGRHQAMMDRYIAGEDVPEKDLRMAWLETTMPHTVWDRTIYADMFRTIREVNQKLPKAQQLRVLLGDTPYDPARPGTVGRTDAFPTELIQREVLGKGRKALIVYVDMHYLRSRQVEPPPPNPAETIVQRLEKSGVKVFSIWTFTAHGEDLKALQADIENWPKPSLTLIRDTTLGVAPFSFYYPKGLGITSFPGPNGQVRLDLSDAIGGVMQQQFDALLYLGPKSEITYAKVPVSLCLDPDYVEMRAKRLGAMGAPGNISPADAFRAGCKAAVEGQ